MRPQLLLIALCAACTNDGKKPAPIDEAVVQFEDVAAQAGLRFVHDAGAGGEYFFPEINGAGGALVDYDGDGDLDVYVVQGGSLDGAGSQGNRLFRNGIVPDGQLRFEDVSAAAGSALGLSEVSRGAAFGDVDNDGDVDILVTNNSGPVRLLRNELDNRNGWLRVRLAGTEASRDAQGAKVALQFDDGSVRWGRAHSDGSYASASDVRVHFGLGSTRQVIAIMVVWPVGTAESWQGIDARNDIQLTQGTGTPLEARKFGLR